MASDTQLALSRITRVQPGALSKMTRQVVPPFLQKLYEMVSDPATDNLIRWSETGDSFFVLDHERVAHDVLPRWFKHNNFASFVRQLNMYGFHKIPHLQQGVLKSDTENEIWNFEHANFHRGQPDLLCLITRKKQAQDRQAEDTNAQLPEGDAAVGETQPGLGANSVMDVNSIINGIAAIKRHQSTISSDLNELKASNQHLWQEAIEARERHKKQQDTINRILKFLAGVFGHSSASRNVSPEGGSPQGIPRRKTRLMIKGVQPSEKEASLEPLDDDDLVSEASEEDTNRIVEVTTPRTDTTQNTTDKPSRTVESETPVIPVTPTDPSSIVMNSGLNGQSPFMPFSHPISQPNPLFYGSSYPRADDGSSSNALTSVSPGMNQDLLQAIINSPGQLQRLMQLLNLQQSNVPVPPPLDLNAPGAQSAHDGITNPVGKNASAQSQVPQPTSLAMPAGYNLSGIDPSAFSLLQPDMAPMSFEPLMSNEKQLDDKYKDAAIISQNIDDIQTSLDSLISNLGFDPTQTETIPDFDGQANIDDPYTTLHSDYPTRAPLSSMPSNFSTATSQPPLTTDSNVDTDNGIPEFDINAFINELARQQNGGDGETNGLHEFPPDGFDPLSHNADGGSTPPRVSGFLDEVNSVSGHSDTPSPSASRDMDELVKGSVPVAKKARKRKSDTDSLSTERPQTKTKRKR